MLVMVGRDLHPDSMGEGNVEIMGTRLRELPFLRSLLHSSLTTSSASGESRTRVMPQTGTRVPTGSAWSAN
jgi:hypothetical protein